jgi:hypothetical protein
LHLWRSLLYGSGTKLTSVEFGDAMPVRRRPALPRERSCSRRPSSTSPMIADNERQIEHATKQNRELREIAMKEARALTEAGDRVRRLEQN